MWAQLWAWLVMAKDAIAQAFKRSVIGGRRYSRAPTDTTAPEIAPVLSTPITTDTTISVAWTNGADSQTGIKDTSLEYRVHGTTDWTVILVTYVAGSPIGSSYTLTGLSAGTAYDIRIANRDNAATPNYSAYASTTVSTTGSNPALEPGLISIAVPSASVLEGGQLQVTVQRTGSGASAPTVEADWNLTGFSGNVPTPSNGTLSWTADGLQTVQATAPAVTADRTGTLNITAVRALSGSIQPSLGTSQIPITIRDTGSSAGVKWHPGHYGLLTSTSSYTTSQLDAIAAANVLGVKVGVGWSTIEPTRGNYSRTFLDQLFSDCRSRGLRVAIEFVDQSFGSGNPVPAYMATEPGANGGYFKKVAGGVETKRYLSAVMNRLLAAWSWIGATYDSEPLFEGIVIIAESAISEGTTQSDWSESGYLTQYLRAVAEVPTYFPTTNVWAGLNFGFGTNTNYTTITTAMRANRCGMRGPDCYVSQGGITKGDYAVKGYVWNGSGWVSGGTDSRGVINIAYDVQGPELGGKENPSSGTNITTLYNQAFATLKCSHLFWLYKNWTIGPTPPDDIYWDNTQSYATNPLAGSQDIKTFLSGSHPLVTTAPSFYSAVNTG